MQSLVKNTEFNKPVTPVFCLVQNFLRYQAQLVRAFLVRGLPKN